MPKKYLDDTGLKRYNSSINTKLNNKVNKDGNKVLSTNDFTTIYKNNVDSNTNARHTHSNKTVLDGISSTDITEWNNKSDFNGNYNNLTNKPISKGNFTPELYNGNEEIVAPIMSYGNYVKIENLVYIYAGLSFNNDTNCLAIGNLPFNINVNFPDQTHSGIKIYTTDNVNSSNTETYNITAFRNLSYSQYTKHNKWKIEGWYLTQN